VICGPRKLLVAHTTNQLLDTTRHTSSQTLSSDLCRCCDGVVPQTQSRLRVCAGTPLPAMGVGLDRIVLLNLLAGPVSGFIVHCPGLKEL